MPQVMTSDNKSRCGIAASNIRVPPIRTAKGIEACRTAVTAATPSAKLKATKIK